MTTDTKLTGAIKKVITEKKTPKTEVKVIVKEEAEKKKDEKKESYSFDDMMISKNEEKILNKLLTMHLYCIQYYMCMSMSCELSEIDGGKEFFMGRCKEEKKCMYDSKKYLLKNNGTDKTGKMDYSMKTYDTVEEIVEYSYMHCIDVKKKYADICNALKNEANPYTIKFFESKLCKAERNVDKMREVYKTSAFPSVLTCGCKLTGSFDTSEHGDK